MFNTQKKILSIIMDKWVNGSYVIIDTETTGLKVDDEIIEIAIINMRGDVLLNTLVKPVNPIPPEATKINNITNEMVASAPVWRDVFPLVKDIISNHKWLAWNSGFDARMMVQTCEKAGVFAGMTPLSIYSIATAIHTSHIDAKATYDQWYGEFDSKRRDFKRQSLTTAAERHNVSVNGAHRALADCMMVLGVLNTVCQPQDKRKPVMFIDGDISPADADKLAAVIREFNEETESPAERMARIIRENPHPTNMCDMPAAGIGVKGE